MSTSPLLGDGSSVQLQHRRTEVGDRHTTPRAASLLQGLLRAVPPSEYIVCTKSHTVDNNNRASSIPLKTTLTRLALILSSSMGDVLSRSFRYQAKSSELAHSNRKLEKQFPASPTPNPRLSNTSTSPPRLRDSICREPLKHHCQHFSTSGMFDDNMTQIE